MKHGVARPNEGEKRCRNGRHAGGEKRAALGSLINGEAILNNLAVGVIEARVDEASTPALWRFLAPGDIVEEITSVFADLKTKVDVRNTGGLTAPSDNSGS